MDANMEYQQNMSGRKMAIFVLKPDGQGKGATRLLGELVQDTLSLLGPGEIRILG